ncbi:MAG: hypothetical protein NTX03_07970 [Bacteroidetes bacterium]|nr:hypothetical protein [Bacteroidota bacterium]
MDNENQSKAEEPTVPYQKRRIAIFNSFEEEHEAQIKYWQSLTHEQRMEQLRIITLYAYSGYEKYTGNRLTFD